MSFSKFIKDKRVASGLTQGDIAKKLGYTTPQFISNWERGLSYPPLSSLPTLADLYDIGLPALYAKLEEDSVRDLKASMRKQLSKYTTKAF